MSIRALWRLRALRTSSKQYEFFGLSTHCGRAVHLTGSNALHWNSAAHQSGRSPKRALKVHSYVLSRSSQCVWKWHIDFGLRFRNTGRGCREFPSGSERRVPQTSLCGTPLNSLSYLSRHVTVLRLNYCKAVRHGDKRAERGNFQLPLSI